MSEEEAGGRPYKEMGILTYEEKKFLLAVERGDVASTRRYARTFYYITSIYIYYITKLYSPVFPKPYTLNMSPFR